MQELCLGRRAACGVQAWLECHHRRERSRQICAGGSLWSGSACMHTAPSTGSLTADIVLAPCTVLVAGERTFAASLCWDLAETGQLENK